MNKEHSRIAREKKTMDKIRARSSTEGKKYGTFLIPFHIP
jgi:hypothetical protein